MTKQLSSVQAAQYIVYHGYNQHGKIYCADLLQEIMMFAQYFSVKNKQIPVFAEKFVRQNDRFVLTSVWKVFTTEFDVRRTANNVLCVDQNEVLDIVLNVVNNNPAVFHDAYMSFGELTSDEITDDPVFSQILEA